MSDLLRPFKKETDERVDYAVIGEKGAVHFWHFKKFANSGGVEEHRKEPAAYQVGRPADHDCCFIIECPCWHDGSSLYADKFFPILEVQGEDAVYIQLKTEYQNRFDECAELAPSNGERKPDAENSADSLNQTSISPTSKGEE